MVQIGFIILLCFKTVVYLDQNFFVDLDCLCVLCMVKMQLELLNSIFVIWIPVQLVQQFLGTGRPGPYLRADAAQAEVSFRNFRFPPIWAFAPILQTDAPHIIAAAQIFFDQTGSTSYHLPT